MLPTTNRTLLFVLAIVAIVAAILLGHQQIAEWKAEPHNPSIVAGLGALVLVFLAATFAIRAWRGPKHH